VESPSSSDTATWNPPKPLIPGLNPHLADLCRSLRQRAPELFQ
jgi:hypothetical protein